MKTQTTRQTVEVKADAEGVVSHAGAHLLAELADRIGLTAGLSEAMAPTRERRSAHDPGVVLRDVIVAVADGGDCVTDLGVLRDQEALFGPVASERTAHRAIKSVDADLLEAIRGARAGARRIAWDAGARPETITLSVDATLLGAASEKEGAAGNYKGGFGFHPLLCYLDETGEPLAAILRPGNAGANTASDHFEVLQLALEQLPEADLDREILVRTDIGGRTHAFTQDCREAGIRFSVGYEVDERVREAILKTPESAWQSAIDAEGEVREGAWVIELTDEVDLSAWPEGTRLIVRRERPHPGAQFQVFDAEGYRHTAFITDQKGAGIAALELRHRRRAKVEDEIRCGKDTGMRNLPFAAFEHNRVWLELSLIAQELLAWLRLLCLEGELALAEPSDCASACCTSPARWFARPVAPRCGCRDPGRGPRRWSRPSPGCGRCRPQLHKHSRAPSTRIRAFGRQAVEACARSVPWERPTAAERRERDAPRRFSEPPRGCHMLCAGELHLPK